MSVSDRLARLLFIVPYVAQRDGVPLAELGEILDASPRQIQGDLDLLTMVGRPPLTPDHLVDLYVEDEMVFVDLHQNLSRPLRLTHDEARALVFAMHAVGSVGGLGDALEALVEKIVEHLNPAEAQWALSLRKGVHIWRDFDAGQESATLLRAAIESTVEVDVPYYSASSDRKKVYRLRPLALLFHSGIDYLVALDVDADAQQKLFRVDRMGEIHVSKCLFEAPQDLDLDQFRTQSLYQGEHATGARVLFGPSAARLVSERFAADQITSLPDGSVQVTLSTSSQAWLARWVLPFGTEAEVVEPLEQRERLGQLCREAAKAYGTS